MSKPKAPYRKTEIAGRKLSPETMMMSYGYSPQLSEWSIKAPVFLTSTFAFESAEAGAAFFRVMGGRRQEGDPESAGLMYSRFNNPNIEVLEDRLTLFDHAEDAAVFSSGMGAISTTLMALAPAGSVVLHSTPLYGGTETLIRKVMPNFGIRNVDFFAAAEEAEVWTAAEEAMKLGPVTVIYTETPTNPTNDLVDLAMIRKIANRIGEKQGGKSPAVVVDNTFLGPVNQQPIDLGADILVYSLTKYVGGHSDLIAGAAMGRSDLMAKIRSLRSSIGTNLDPHTAWMLMRSLETVTLRMNAATENAKKVAEYLARHPKVEKVRYLGFLEPGSRSAKIHENQAKAAGSTFSFDVKGGQAGAFKFLNSLQVVKLAVSLGGTETLICHPGSTTHAAVDPELQERCGYTPGMVRISIGIEDPDDLIADIGQALDQV
ncbi:MULTISPECIES: cystathionine gamma-synthase family protein [Hyphobacterium]|uniref:Cystathionine gamma-synthase family protein n=1 Tax=Hyphobacterium vulgare TaxID=1736751 RepID=A0ABV6ZUG9_9PROT